MVSKSIRLLNHTRAKVVRLERVVATQLSRELASLPRQYGFVDVHDFITAVRKSAGKSTVSAGKKVAGYRGKVRKSRVVITADIKAKLRSLVGAGKTGNEIADALNISIPSVQNIKRELGLVKHRK